MKKCYILKMFGKGQAWAKRGIEGVERTIKKSEATRYSKQEADTLCKQLRCRPFKVSST